MRASAAGSDSMASRAGRSRLDPASAKAFAASYFSGSLPERRQASSPSRSASRSGVDSDADERSRPACANARLRGTHGQVNPRVLRPQRGRVPQPFPPAGSNGYAACRPRSRREVTSGDFSSFSSAAAASSSPLAASAQVAIMLSTGSDALLAACTASRSEDESGTRSLASVSTAWMRSGDSRLTKTSLILPTHSCRSRGSYAAGPIPARCRCGIGARCRG